jgi:hypothetical protein
MSSVRRKITSTGMPRLTVVITPDTTEGTTSAVPSIAAWIGRACDLIAGVPVRHQGVDGGGLVRRPDAAERQSRRKQIQPLADVGDHARSRHAAEELSLLLRRKAQSGSEDAHSHGAEIPHLREGEGSAFELAKLPGHAGILFLDNCLGSNNRKIPYLAFGGLRSRRRAAESQENKRFCRAMSHRE